MLSHRPNHDRDSSYSSQQKGKTDKTKSIFFQSSLEKYKKFERSIFPRVFVFPLRYKTEPKVLNLPRATEKLKELQLVSFQLTCTFLRIVVLLFFLVKRCRIYLLQQMQSVSKIVE